MTRRAASEHHVLAVDAAIERSGHVGGDGPGGVVGHERIPSTSTSMSAQRCLTAWKSRWGAELLPLLGVGDREVERGSAMPEQLGGVGRRRPDRAALGQVGAAEDAGLRAVEARSQPTSAGASIAGSRRAGRPAQVVQRDGRRTMARRPRQVGHRCVHRRRSRRAHSTPRGLDPPMSAGGASSSAAPPRRTGGVRRQRPPCDRNGAGATWRPTCSSSTVASTKPSPSPPSASGRSRAVHPCSTMACHSGGSNPPPASTMERTRPGAGEVIEQLAGGVAQRQLVLQEAFRAECREWLRPTSPWEYGQGPPPTSTTWPRRWPSCALAGQAGRRRLGWA
jgi:hypothetical protein